MFVDYLTAAAAADHLRRTLLGARVQSVVQPNRLTLTFELFASGRHYLTLTADPAREGIALSTAKARRGDDPPSPLFQATRAHLVGARLADVDQPLCERSLVFGFAGAEHWRLVAELTGRMANLILLNADDTVRVAARRVTAKMSGVRQITPGRPYKAPPPPAGKVALEEYASRLPREVYPPGTDATEARPKAWETLVANIRGVSPLLAKEAVHRATGRWQAPAEAAADGAIVAALAELLRLPETGAWQPTVARNADGRVVAYAPYRLTHLAGVEERPSIFAALEEYEASAALGASHSSVDRPMKGADAELPAGAVSAPAAGADSGSAAGRADGAPADAYADARQGVARLLAAAEGKLRRRLGALEREAAREADLEELKTSGDLILAFQWQLQKGDKQLAVVLDPGEAPTIIAIDPALSPVANAERYFERYKRSRRARAALPERIGAVQQQLDALAQLGLDLELAPGRPAIDAVHDALLDGGFLVDGRRRLPKSAAPAGPLCVISEDGFTLWVGRNSRQNEVVTFKKASRDDLWLHTAEVPGAHVVIKNAGRPVPESTVLEAAALAVRYSKARGELRVPVLVTEARHVRRVPGGAPGLVTVRAARTVIT